MMKKISTAIFYRRTALTLCCAAGLFLAGRIQAQDAVEAHDAWARLPLPSKTQTALFVTLENHSAEKRAVVSASSDAAEKVELHEMKTDGKMMRMSPVAQIDIPANGKTALKPGGFHIMLFGLKTRPAEGDTLRVILKLDDGATVPVTATYRSQPAE